MLARIIQSTRFFKTMPVRYFAAPKAEAANYADTSHIKPDDFKRMQESLKKFS